MRIGEDDERTMGIYFSKSKICVVAKTGHVTDYVCSGHIQYGAADLFCDFFHLPNGFGEYVQRYVIHILFYSGKPG